MTPTTRADLEKLIRDVIRNGGPRLNPAAAICDALTAAGLAVVPREAPVDGPRYNKAARARYNIMVRSADLLAKGER